MSQKFFDLTFTESVKAAQKKYGSRQHYLKYNGIKTDFNGLTDVEKEFISQRDGFYMATVNSENQPYVQFRGGEKGFLKTLDDKTLGFADFRGNLQYISVGNLQENNKTSLFLMDYANQTRLKILATVEVKDAAEVPELIDDLTVPNYKAKIERAIIFHVEAFDWNCPQHITPRYTMEEFREMIAPLYEHIEKLEKEIEILKKS